MRTSVAPAVAHRRGVVAVVLNHSLHTDEGRRVGIPDAYLPDVSVAIQVHSRAHHSGIDDAGTGLWSSTVEHDNDLSAHGVLVLGVTPTTLARHPQRFLRQLSSAVTSRRGLPQPYVTMRSPDDGDTDGARACAGSP